MWKRLSMLALVVIVLAACAAPWLIGRGYEHRLGRALAATGKVDIDTGWRAHATRVATDHFGQPLIIEEQATSGPWRATAPHWGWLFAAGQLSGPLGVLANYDYHIDLKGRIAGTASSPPQQFLLDDGKQIALGRTNAQFTAAPDNRGFDIDISGESITLIAGWQMQDVQVQVAENSEQTKLVWAAASMATERWAASQARVELAASPQQDSISNLRLSVKFDALARPDGPELDAVVARADIAQVDFESLKGLLAAVVRLNREGGMDDQRLRAMYLGPHLIALLAREPRIEHWQVAGERDGVPFVASGHLSLVEPAALMTGDLASAIDFSLEGTLPRDWLATRLPMAASLTGIPATALTERLRDTGQWVMSGPSYAINVHAAE